MDLTFRTPVQAGRGDQSPRELLQTAALACAPDGPLAAVVSLLEEDAASPQDGAFLSAAVRAVRCEPACQAFRPIARA